MPTLLPPRGPASCEGDEFSPVLVLIIAVLAIFLVLAEAQAMAGTGWTFSLPPEVNMILPV
jgi:hypothetical protein